MSDFNKFLEQRDIYLESLYLTLEMCQLTIENRTKFSPDVVRKAEEIARITKERICLRELIPPVDRI